MSCTTTTVNINQCTDRDSTTVDCDSILLSTRSGNRKAILFILGSFKCILVHVLLYLVEEITTTSY